MNANNNIPECLKKQDRWVCWQIEDRGGKPTKVPINPLTGGRAMSNNSVTWGTFYDAIECLEKGTGLKGIGFMFNGDGTVGVDIDHCRNPETGKIEDFAADIINTMDSYTEASQSGNGIHILCRGKLPEGKRRKGSVEMYETGRFFVMTGNIIDDAHMDIEDRTEELAAVHKKYLSETEKAKTVNNPVETVLNLDENEIIQKAMNAKNGTLFSQLYSGSWKGIYGSQSEADMAFCNMLAFWCGRDYTMMDRIFRKSGMYRVKWDEKRGACSYGEKTLREAITSCSEVYTSKPRHVLRNSENIQSSLHSAPEEQKEAHDKADTLTFNGVQESLNGYIKICRVPPMPGEEETEKKIVKKPITNFIIEPVQLIASDDSTELKAFIKYNHQEIPITLTANDFSSPRDFKNSTGAILGPSSGWFDGKQSELTGIQRIIDSKEVQRVRGVKTSGFHFIDKKWVYVTSGGAIDGSKKTVDTVALLETCKGIDNHGILIEESANVDDLKGLAPLLFSFNSPGVTSLFVGYMCALFLKERLWHELGFKFPHMALIGASGSGKSQTMESVGIPIMAMTAEQQLASKQATPFTTLKLASSSNTVPFVLNEFKPHKLPQYRLDEIDNLINNTYDRYRGDRGQANQTIRTYQYSAPVVLIGESYNADTSAVERIIRIYLSRDESTKCTESFLKIKKMSEVLRRLGKSLLLETLNLDSERLKRWHDVNMDLLGEKSIKTSRGCENLAKVMCGIDLLQMIYINAGLNFSDEKVVYLKSQAIERYQVDTLEGNTSSKSAVGEVLEAIDQLAYKQSILHDKHYKILDRSGELALDIKSIYEVLEKETASRKNTLPLSQAEFTRLLRKESFFSSYKTVVLVSPGSIEEVKKPRGSFVLSIQGLRESGIDLSSILGNESSFQQLEWAVYK